MTLDFPAQVFAYGFSYRKREILSGFLSGIKIKFVRDLRSLPVDATVVIWGAKEISSELALQRRIVRVEDGFFRSVGLGSDFIKPSSLVFDQSGIYFDARTPSDLEKILADATFTDEELKHAKQLREFIVEHGLTKYNIEKSSSLKLNTQHKWVIFVPGQVEDDASIQFGGGNIRTNLDLLKSVRASNPDAYIIFKPHPDVMAMNRKGAVSKRTLLKYADLIDSHFSVIDCIDAANEIHTMSSLVGFDALLRGKKVVTYGQPFYAGWGLTQDRYHGDAILRRKRALTVDALMVGALVRYPVYWDWSLNQPATCEQVLHDLMHARNRLIQEARLEQLRFGFIRRQFRKLWLLSQSIYHSL